MDNSTINRLVGGQQKANGIYRTIEACNTGGSISPDYEAEELEELESRGLNPFWDTNIFRNNLKIQAIISFGSATFDIPTNYNTIWASI